MIGFVIDSSTEDDARRRDLYEGTVHVSGVSAARAEFCAFARALLTEAFKGNDPETAQYRMDVEDYAALLADLKPRFIHHPRSKELVRAVLAELGCDLDLTYFDVPRLRSSTSDGYLTSGIAYAWHPHRDTWYSAPMTQLNFWIPVYRVSMDNAMAFHLDYFGTPVPNDSHAYNYYEWNSKYRAMAAANVGAETRPLPGPTVRIDTANAVVPVPPVGGLIEFSGQHLHSSVPNQTGRTRFSIDFRTVHIGDISAGLGAANVDAECTGSSIRDFIRASDFEPVPADVVTVFDDGSEHRGDLMYNAGT
jgi:hypothetical protein